MRAGVVGFLSLCCITAVYCELHYQGPIGSKHSYSYEGVSYEVSDGFHRFYQANPREAEQKFAAEIQKPKVARVSTQDFSTKRSTPKHETTGSGLISSFESNKGSKGSSAINFHFPQSEPSSHQPNANQDVDSFPTPNVGFIQEIPREREREHYKGTSAVSNFAWNLFKNSNTKPNIVISPLSPQILLSYLAWVADGGTRNEITAAIGYGSPNQLQTIVKAITESSANRELDIASAFFIAEDMRINQEFLEKSVEFVDLVSVDFRNPDAARSVINRWAKKKTKGALRLREINYAPSTKMALASSIYFKGKWVYTFEDAKPGTFFTKTGPVEAKMMNIKKKFRWGKLGNYAEWVALPYESSDSLIIILPNRQQNVDDVINLIDGNDIDEIMQGIDSESTKANVNITLPRFRLESTSSLVEPLKKMGISTLFTQNADLSYLSDYDTVQVNNAQQQTSLEVNEQGTVFVAFTNLNVVALSFQVPVPEVSFNVNRPFIALIANTKKKIPYMVGKISNPLG